MTYRENSLKGIVEDTFLLAHRIRVGDDLEEGEGSRDYRIAELVISMAERTARLCGLENNDLWMPGDGTEEMIDVS